MTSQTNRLRAHLDTGAPIDRLSALTDLGIFELAARLNTLTREGYPITKRPKTVVNRWGERVRVMEYRNTNLMPARLKVDLQTRNQ